MKRMTCFARNSTTKANRRSARHEFPLRAAFGRLRPELFDERCTLGWCLSPRTSCVSLPASQLSLVLATDASRPPDPLVELDAGEPLVSAVENADQGILEQVGSVQALVEWDRLLACDL